MLLVVSGLVALAALLSGLPIVSTTSSLLSGYGAFGGLWCTVGLALMEGYMTIFFTESLVYVEGTSLVDYVDMGFQLLASNPGPAGLATEADDAWHPDRDV